VLFVILSLISTDFTVYLVYSRLALTSQRESIFKVAKKSGNRIMSIQHGSKKGYYTPISFVGHFTLWSIVTVSPTQTSNVGLGNCIPFGSDATLLDMYVHLCHK
jgi:hypothetical protein